MSNSPRKLPVIPSAFRWRMGRRFDETHQRTTAALAVVDGVQPAVVTVGAVASQAVNFTVNP